MAIVAGGGAGPKKKVVAAPKVKKVVAAPKVTDIRYPVKKKKVVAAPPAKATVAPKAVYPASSYAAPAAPAKVAPAAPAPAVGTPAAVTTGVPQPNAYPWLDREFGKYFQSIQQDFADRGLLDSTNKLAPMTELADAYSGRWAQEARVDNQNSINNALALWERLTSANLARQNNELAAGMDYKYEGVAQPSIFADIFKNVYLPPTKSSGGPVGDAPVVEPRRPTMTRPLGVDTARGQVVPTYTESAPNYAYRDNQANIASQMELQRQQEARLAQAASEQSRIQNAYLALAQEQDKRAAAGATDENDPWAAMAADVMSNRMQAQDDISGNERHPTDLFQWFNAAYNVDLEAEIRANNPRALALVRSAYSDPKVAEAVIQRVMNGGSWKKPESAAAASPLAGGGAPPTKAGPRYSIAADIPEWKKQYTTPYSDGVFSTVTDAEDVTDRLMPTTVLYRLADWLFNPSRPKF